MYSCWKPRRHHQRRQRVDARDISPGQVLWLPRKESLKNMNLTSDHRSIDLDKIRCLNTNPHGRCRPDCVLDGYNHPVLILEVYGRPSNTHVRFVTLTSKPVAQTSSTQNTMTTQLPHVDNKDSTRNQSSRYQFVDDRSLDMASHVRLFHSYELPAKAIMTYRKGRDARADYHRIDEASVERLERRLQGEQPETVRFPLQVLTRVG